MRVERLGEGEPELAVVGGIHGDEPCGSRGVEHFLKERPDLERPVAFIITNEEAIAASRRYIDADLNRSFPGDPDGDAHESRLAHAVGEAVGDCVTLALHSTQSYDRMFALVDEVDDLARRVCPRLSVDAVVETRAREGRIFQSVPDTIELECGYQGSAQAARNAVQVIREFLTAAGAMRGGETPYQTSLPVYRLGDPVPKQAADTYEVYVRNFESVDAGETVASADGDPVVAQERFHPVLFSATGYENVFGYTSQHVGTLSV